MQHSEILKFWFEELGAARWWAKDDQLDGEIARRFGPVHARASRCELFEWRSEPSGRLAEVIVLDQFSRNMFRGAPEAFASDPLALALAQESVRIGADMALTTTERNFLYMPFMHSESLAIHDVARELFGRNGDDSTIEFERRHRAIIERFGRYPHRNAALGRQSTGAEIEFLKEPASGF